MENREDGIIIYNSLTSGVLSLNQTYSKSFLNFVERDEKLPKYLRETLKSGKMIVDEKMDEDAYFHVLNKSA